MIRKVRVMIVNGLGEREDVVIDGENMYFGLTLEGHFPCYPFEEALVIRETGEEGLVLGVFPRENVLGCLNITPEEEKPVSDDAISPGERA